MREIDQQAARDLIHFAAVVLGRTGGRKKSPRKTATARENGKLGGRPRKAKGAAAAKSEGETRGETL